jgi:hypothetical protein
MAVVLEAAMAVVEAASGAAAASAVALVAQACALRGSATASRDQPRSVRRELSEFRVAALQAMLFTTAVSATVSTMDGDFS